ncbi:MAG: hypothetical protein IKD31_05875 [Clostridia bacterium]|nr:hypothetical protein [Clostridia bacterium]
MIERQKGRVRRRKVKGRRYFPFFWVIYTVLIAVFAVALSYGLGWLNRFLVAFENSQPIHRAEAIFREYFSGSDYVAALEKSNFKVGEYETLASVSRYLTELKGEREVSYYSISTSETEAKYNFVFIDPADLERDETNTAPENDIQGVPSTKIATVRFVRSDVADEFGFFGYEFADMEMFATPTHSFKVTLPASSKLYCNGKEVSAEKKTAEEPHPFNQFLPKGLDVEGVTMVTYEASGLFLEPEMRAVDRDLIPHVLTFLEDEGGYRSNLNYSADLKDAYSKRIMEGMQAYACHMQNDVRLAVVKPYFDLQSEFYIGILENLSQFVWDHDSYEFQNQYIDEFYRFDDNTFCCHVSFDHVLKLRGREDYIDRLDMIIFARKIGNEFYIYDRWVQ